MIQSQVPVRAAMAGVGVEACEPRVCRDLAKVNGMCMKKRKSKMEEE